MPSSGWVWSGSHIHVLSDLELLVSLQLVILLCQPCHISRFIAVTPLISLSSSFLRHQLSTNNPTGSLSCYSDRLSAFTRDESLLNHTLLSEQRRTRTSERKSRHVHIESSLDLKIFKIPLFTGKASVKVRRDSRKRSQPILANIGHFLLPLERVRCNSEYIGKTEFFGSSPLHSATRSAATALIMKDKYCKIRCNYRNHDQGPLIAWLEVSTHVATLHDTALPGHHKADNDFSALWRGLET
jgi:hypothetical protein